MASIFNRQIKLLQRNRIHRNQLTYIRDETASRLVDRLLDIKRSFPKVLDLGSGSGHIIKYVDKSMMDTLVHYELSGILCLINSTEKLLNSQDSSVLNRDVVVQKIQGDEENIKLPENSFDAILSNLSLHWVNDLPGTLIQAQKILKSDGLFLGCMFGGETLYELRTSLQLAEIERKGGISPHVSPMTNVKDVASLLSRANFSLTTVDVDEIQVSYPSLFELLQDLREMGESSAFIDPSTLSRDTLMAASAVYKEIYGNSDGSIPATFQIIYMIGWKPDDSQPKPLKRGSAKVSLKSTLMDS